MDIQIKPEREWRTRGRPTEPIPDEVKHVLDRTYRTREIGEVDLSTDQKREEMLTFVQFARRHAKERGLYFQMQPRRIQPTTTNVRFRMIDVPAEEQP